MRRFSNLSVLAVIVSACAMGSTGAHGSANSPNPELVFVAACGLILATMAHLAWKTKRTK